MIHHALREVAGHVLIFANELMDPSPSAIEDDGPIQGVLWQRLVSHSFRPAQLCLSTQFVLSAAFMGNTFA